MGASAPTDPPNPIVIELAMTDVYILCGLHFRSYSQLLLVFVYDWTPELVEELEGNIEKRKEYAF